MIGNPKAAMEPLLTERLQIRELALADGPFILRLLNEPSFIRNITDKGVRTLAQAEDYLRNGPMASYAARDHGLDAVVRRDTGAVIGICGLIRRDAFPDIDLGYAFLPEHTGLGFAREAAQACLADAFGRLHQRRVIALVNPDNDRSIHLLARCGFVFEQRTTLPPSGDEVCLYACTSG